jgi:hypothetical protein
MVERIEAEGIVGVVRLAPPPRLVRAAGRGPDDGGG